MGTGWMDDGDESANALNSEGDVSLDVWKEEDEGEVYYGWSVTVSVVVAEGSADTMEEAKAQAEAAPRTLPGG